MKKRKALKIVSSILLVLSIILFLISLYISTFFTGVTFEQLLYSIINFKGTSMIVILKGVGIVIVMLIIFYLLYRLFKFLINKVNYKVLVNISFGKKNININFKKVFKVLSIVLLLYFSCDMLKVQDYIRMIKKSSKLYEKYYVDPRSVKIEFPKKKRNLIYIYLESMETSNASIENGGFFNESYIPNLEKIALDNINFSNTDKLGGPIMMYGTNYTSAALVATTAGIPLKVPVGWRNYRDYGENLPGVYNLGDILKDNGYNNYFMIGSDGDYGGRKDYFKHGSYEIDDYYWAIDEGLIDKDYHVWWGYEDKKLFEYAKDKLSKISKEDEPFNFTLLTVDTHFTDGYMDSTCENKFEKKYANAIYCSDNKVGEFINWIKKQDFYDNTTIIIVGDHLSMQAFFYRDDDTYERTMYNVLINSSVQTPNSKNRLYTSFDMFPTDLASLGVKIEGNKLGLGVNLFSNEKTLLEKLGKEKFNSELKSKSVYYNNKFLKDHYFKMEKELKEQGENNEVD